MFAGELDLVYIAPERLLQRRCLELLDRCEVALFVIDEANCDSQWDHDFRLEYLQLAALAERFPAVKRITAGLPTRGEIAARLHMPSAEVFVHSFAWPNIRYSVAERQDGTRQLSHRKRISSRLTSLAGKNLPDMATLS